MGGGVNTQRTLMLGIPEDVHSDALGRSATFAKNGGFIFNADHNIQADVPTANVVAMFESVNEVHGT